jgi:hypothetical protein
MADEQSKALNKDIRMTSHEYINILSLSGLNSSPRVFASNGECVNAQLKIQQEKGITMEVKVFNPKQ